jgi:hypothetical protein
MKVTNQWMIFTLVSKATGHSEDLVKFVVMDFFKQIKLQIKLRLFNKIRIDGFLTFIDYEKKRNNDE